MSGLRGPRERRPPVPLDAYEEIPKQEFVKCVVIGDTAVGKTRLICSYVYNQEGIPLAQLNQGPHLPTVFAIDQYMVDPFVRRRANVVIDGVHVCLRTWDTFGDHEKNRKFAYQNSHVIVLCFSIGSYSSLRHINAKWFPEIRKYCPRAPIILVGTQLDRRYTDPNAFKSLCRVARLRDLLTCQSTALRVVDDGGLVPPEVGRQTSREIGAYGYYETSVVTKFGVNDVFENAIRAALIGRRLSRPIFSSQLKKVEKPKLQEPFLPAKPDAPTVTVCPSFHRQEYKLLVEDNEQADVVFNVQGELVCGHCVILTAASPIFACLFTHPQVLASLGITNLSVGTGKGILVQDGYANGLSASLPRGFFSIDVIQDGSAKNCKLFVKVNNIPPAHFKELLGFLYHGELVVDEICLESLLESALYLQLSPCVEYLQNIMNNVLYMNLEVCKRTRRHMVGEMYRLFFDKPLFADVTFSIDGNQILAHKAVLTAHCPMMAGMFRNGNFRESGTPMVEFKDTNLESFLAVLEYLYTDNCSALHLGDPLGTLSLANFFCVPRLVSLCEQHLVKQLTAVLEESSITEAAANVLSCFHASQLHNAPQLTAWCLHAMACNYNDFCKVLVKEFKLLDPTTVKYLEQNRWPPIWYIKEEDFYRKASREIEIEKERKMHSRHKRKCPSCL